MNVARPDVALDRTARDLASLCFFLFGSSVMAGEISYLLTSNSDRREMIVIALEPWVVIGVVAMLAGVVMVFLRLRAHPSWLLLAGLSVAFVVLTVAGVSPLVERVLSFLTGTASVLIPLWWLAFARWRPSPEQRGG